MIDRETQIELHLYNLGVQRARDAYREQPNTLSHRCAEALCTEETTCWRCLRRARADLLVATSQAECADLLAIIDRPASLVARCGTDAGYQAHLKRGERTCTRCRKAHAAYCAFMKRGRA